MRGGVGGAIIPHVFYMGKKNIPTPLLSAPDKSTISITYAFIFCIFIYVEKLRHLRHPHTGGRS